VSFEEASENAQKAAENCDQVTQAYENLKTALEEVNKIEDPFKNLSKGTAEWNLALLEANNKITDLISKYPKLAKYVEESSNVEGLKVISKEGQEEILKE
jgi:archaellum component FlaC